MNPATRLLERVVGLIDPVGPEHGNVTEARNLIKEAAILPGAHVGDDPESFDERKTCEWLLGQFASIIDSEGWFAMNSLLNVARHNLDLYRAGAA